MPGPGAGPGIGENLAREYPRAAARRYDDVNLGALVWHRANEPAAAVCAARRLESLSGSPILPRGCSLACPAVQRCGVLPRAFGALGTKDTLPLPHGSPKFLSACEGRL